MLSALRKKLTKTDENENHAAGKSAGGVVAMDPNLRRKFARGVQYNRNEFQPSFIICLV